MEVDLRKCINPVYQPLLYNRDRWLVLYGGAGSGKSYFAAQKVLIRCMNEPGHRFIVSRKVAKTIRQSAFALLCFYIGQWDLEAHWRINKSEMTLEFEPNGSTVLCVGMDDQEKLKSIFDPTSMWHEEPTELLPADLTQLNLRLRGETPYYKQHILTFNPISVRHWLKAKFFDTKTPATTTLRTTHRDNIFIDDEYRRELEQLSGNDALVYEKGEWGILKGAIYQPFNIPAVWPASFDETIYGLDFGYNNPMALIECNLKDREPYLVEKIYESGLTTNDLVDRMKRLGINRQYLIYCDSAEPDRIEELRRNGFNVRGAAKGQNSVKAGIAFCQGLNIHTRVDNENLNAENNSYVWKVDANENPMDEPVKENDHGMDAMRYALHSHLPKPKPARGLSRAMLGA